MEDSNIEWEATQPVKVMSRIDNEIEKGSDRKTAIKSTIDELIDTHRTRYEEEYGVIFEGYWIPRWKPWVNMFEDIEGTLLGKDRLYMIWQYLSNIDFLGKFYECGVYEGGVTKMALNMGFDCVAFDTFSGIKGADEDMDYHEDDQYSADLFTVSEKIKGAEIVVGDVRETLTKRNDIVAMAHIDLDVYEPTLAALEAIYPMLHDKGVIIVDDYGFSHCTGVKDACDQFLKGKHVYLPTGQLVIMK